MVVNRLSFSSYIYHSSLYFPQPDPALHSVSPALSTHVPMAPAGTPANFLSAAGKSPALNGNVTPRISSHNAVSVGDKTDSDQTLMSSPVRKLRTLSPLDAERTMSTLDDQGLHFPVLLLPLDLTLRKFAI